MRKVLVDEYSGAFGNVPRKIVSLAYPLNSQSSPINLIILNYYS
jgi:hypothetical protein